MNFDVIFQRTVNRDLALELSHVSLNKARSLEASDLRSCQRTGEVRPGKPPGVLGSASAV